MSTIKRATYASIIFAQLAFSHAESANIADELIEASGVQGGLVVVLDNEQITSEMRANDSYLVQGLFRDEKSKASARKTIQSKGIYGPVTVRSWEGERLPYLDNMVNLIIAEDHSSVSLDEIFRVLAPYGVLLSRKEIKAKGSKPVNGWHRVAKPWPDTIDEWTHWMHAPDNNAVSQDTYANIPRGLQWIQPPRWWKSHELAPPFSAMVTAKGRLFYIADESLPGIADLPDRWYLIARDAFNGTLLWKKSIKEWGGEFWKETYIQGGGARLLDPNQVLRRLVAVDDKVFVTLGLFAPVSMLDSATGEVLKTFEGTEDAFEILYEKGRLYLAVNPGLKDHEPGPEISVMAVDTDSGEICWEAKGYQGRWQTEKLSPQFVDAHLTLGKEGLFFLDKAEIVALDLNTGNEKWSTKSDNGSGSSKSIKQRSFGRSVLTYHDSILFHCAQKGAPLTALHADSGKKMWEKDAGSIAYHTSPDIFVNRGLVWILNSKAWTYEGLDPTTGENKKSLDVSLISKGTHHNCFRNKATQDFFMYGRVKGVEYFNIDRNEAKRVNWLKGACRYGIMPANGMIYFPAHFCTCYATSKMNGIAAIGNTGITEAEPSTADDVVRGPAYGKALSASSGEEDWPTYRQNIARTGFQPVGLSEELDTKWTSQIGGNLTPPVVADQKVFVASKDDHRVICLDAKGGKTKWTFLADGKVDSPPSFYKGRLVFGARDGSVYCLDAASGELAWRFRAAPQDRQMGAFEQVESVWPVFGTLLVHDDKVYCTAGRHSNVNQGIYLYQLDVKTGCPLIGVHHIPDISHQGETETTVNADILVGDGNIMHLRGMVFDMKTLKMIDIGKRFIERAAPAKNQTNFQTSLTMALGGFLDDSFFNGSFWYYNDKTANILSLDEENLYGVNIYSKNSFKSSSHVNFHPGKQTIKLFAARLNAASSRGGTAKRRSKEARVVGALWSSTIPIKAKSLVVGSDRLYLAGVRDKVDKEDPWAHFEGRMGGLITVHSKKDGNLARTIELESPPVFDGLASAGGKLFVSCRDGSVLCFE
jgi:outer membrane protein assembly factor BamB